MDLAEQIARDLMTSSNGEKADRLKLFQGERYLGGWSLEGLAGRIRKHLNGKLSTDASRQKVRDR